MHIIKCCDSVFDSVTLALFEKVIKQLPMSDTQKQLLES